jgi:hypothetical protein
MGVNPQRMLEYYEAEAAKMRRLIAKNKDFPKPAVDSDKKRRIWRHNSFLGHAVMMRQQLNAILAADSTTPETKQIARSMLGLVSKLQNSLATRKD